jgi:hypothetical protein
LAKNERRVKVFTYQILLVDFSSVHHHKISVEKLDVQKGRTLGIVLGAETHLGRRSKGPSRDSGTKSVLTIIMPSDAIILKVTKGEKLVELLERKFERTGGLVIFEIIDLGLRQADGSVGGPAHSHEGSKDGVGRILEGSRRHGDDVFVGSTVVLSKVLCENLGLDYR